ncbi:iron export ABC transporter permease subunit FetB [Erwinia aphidicola]|jgi:putative ABC transport system permease protein|uniref:iron efflux ABC transporter permease subunit FetB n=1 Tax=Erwinia TaxID=551 RepID=UPI00066463C0|nr:MULTISPECIES: iron export ABC transporter permease subunit FetB [Erwinia]KMV69480.1 membrane protein [bacteria symbiont BFo1 of Frankliniella occidentalis]KYP83950.1 membrane protein [bacteria symbiont BFo1 of Frankliniella occidentalis]KYP89325.1 membrane protein [bacteria symbiont BFo1 of Frankliniella occidentalis]MBN1085043.1 iron export ABC transporter permease subunit FetB [Erwinia aphidicola]MDI3441204.1 iron export ABC transporter permease subunit FetB [Erwinia sp. V90_4]
MNQHNITNESLALALVLVLIALLVSKKERLGLEKDIVWSVARAIVQLVIVGYVLKYIFDLNNRWLTILMVLFICVNAALNAKKRSRAIDHGFVISFIAITLGTTLTLAILLLSGAIEFMPMQVIPISGMIAGNAMVAVGLCFSNLNQRFSDNRQKVEEMLSLGASAKLASGSIVRDSIRAAMIPTVDAAKTVGLVSLPGMMSGLIFAGIDPVKAIKYQIMVTFMLLGTASLSTIVAGYLAARRFYTARVQLK